MTFKIKDSSINRGRGRRCDGKPGVGGEVLVCVCVGFGRENGEEIRDKDSFLNLSSVISLSLPPTLQPEIDRAVVGMDTCPVTSMLAQLTH